MSATGYSGERRYEWIVYGIAVALVGGLAGYILALQGPRSSAAAAAPAAVVPSASAAPVVDESQVQAYRDILRRDPRNLQAAVSAANLLYDAQRYADAIPFYEQAIAIAPGDINVSTDLGTALWYAGRADDAIARFEKSLAIDASHPQTLFNEGIVRADGKHDYAGAITAWEKLLAANPTYDNAARVRELIAGARAKLQG